MKKGALPQPRLSNLFVQIASLSLILTCHIDHLSLVHKSARESRIKLSVALLMTWLLKRRLDAARHEGC
ncbi:MAG TPA: hypothetical protein VF658_18505 [Pyrinomonadaceae bacterium]|jgi:hypothetical protein